MNVLLIADDTALADFLLLLLQPSGAAIAIVTTVQEALFKLVHQPIDLIIFDLPEINQGQSCHLLRAACPAPILILSAQDDPTQVAAALDAGADLFLTKPITSRILLANIKTLVRRQSLTQGITHHWYGSIPVSK